MMAMMMVLMVAMGASAQTKPYGAFDVGVECTNVPEWIVFSGIESFRSIADMTKARQCSERTGMKWVLKFGFDQLDGTENLAREARTRAMASGLLPYIIAVQFNEEWYGQAQTGKWGPVTFDLIDAIHAYGSEQHRILQSVFGLPIVYVDAFYNNNKAYGLGFYRPLPAHTTTFGMETYVPNGGRWDTHVKPFLDYVLAQNDGVSVALIAQTFKHPKEWNDALSNGPSESDGQKFKAALLHPKVIAAWLFTWRDRINGIKGAQSMPMVVGWFR